MPANGRLDDLGRRGAAAGRLRPAAAGVHVGLDDDPIDERPADRRRAHDVVARAAGRSRLLVRDAQLAGRDRRGAALGHRRRCLGAARSVEQTFVLIANPGEVAGQARVRVLPSERAHVGLNLRSASEESNHDQPRRVPGECHQRSAHADPLRRPRLVVVESIGPAPVPIVVESAKYASPNGVEWSRGSNTLAAPLP